MLATLKLLLNVLIHHKFTDYIHFHKLKIRWQYNLSKALRLKFVEGQQRFISLLHFQQRKTYFALNISEI